jgi:hypothetical protein
MIDMVIKTFFSLNKEGVKAEFFLGYDRSDISITEIGRKVLSALMESADVRNIYRVYSEDLATTLNVVHHLDATDPYTESHNWERHWIAVSTLGGTTVANLNYGRPVVRVPSVLERIKTLLILIEGNSSMDPEGYASFREALMFFTMKECGGDDIFFKGDEYTTLDELEVSMHEWVAMGDEQFLNSFLPQTLQPSFVDIQGTPIDAELTKANLAKMIDNIEKMK